MFRSSPPAAVRPLRQAAHGLTLALALCLGAPPLVADVASFTLIDAATDLPIPAHDPLIDGAILDPSEVPSELSVRANVSEAVGSVVFALSGAEVHNQTESVAPYALFGDSGGDYNPWTPTVGAYALTAQSFSGADGGGAAGTPLTVNFTVGDVGAPPDGDGGVSIFGGQPGSADPVRRWHRGTLALAGPGASENSTPNPFLDYRFQVRFTGPSGQVLDVPGYFAGDGEGDLGGGGAGHVWYAHLAPDEVGAWTYEISFRSGVEVAVETTTAAGAAVAPYDGLSGGFQVVASDKSGADFRAPDRGLIRNRGGHYLSEADGDPWLKGGPNIPENLLGYTGFDNTPDAGHAFSAHVTDWRDGDPDWGGGDGRALIGALNYLADRGVNVIYFLPMNVFGDGNDTFPTVSTGAKTRYDLSKLRQWEIVFDHAQTHGIFLHFVLAETESGNENYHDDGDLGPERKLYYRMLTALFGHHNGLEWNLGEENDYGTAKREAFAAYLKVVDPYDHPVTTHTHSNQYEQFYNPLLGNGDFDITSFQGNASRTTMFDLIVDWRERSAAAGTPWAVSYDEPQRIENDPFDDSRGYPHGRRDKMWPVFMAGGAGFEWYVQEDGGGHSFDQRIDDFSEMDAALRWTGHALGLFSTLPLDDMVPDRTSATSAASGEVYTFAVAGEVYLIYHDRAGGPLALDLSDVPATETFDVRWFDPRQGGALLVGDVSEVVGGLASTDLGSAPRDVDQDWACLVIARSQPIFSDGFESGDLSAWSAVVQ
ncbi:MAG: DUF5060 domain-containing protein [Acidobacteriota bacterium]